MTVNVADLVSPGIRGITPYEPGRPIEEVERELGDALPPGGVVKLASNENPLGPSPRAIAAVTAAIAKANLYPDGGGFYLRRRLAALHGVSEGEILLGNGSNELIDLLVRTFCTSGDEVLAPARSFLCYRIACQAHGVSYMEVSRGPHFAYRIDALIEAVTPRTKLLFLANPDNPTGVYANRGELQRLLEGVPERVIIVLDEAYLEYASAADYPDSLALRASRPMMISLRTFSKIHGLAGLRCGYAVGAREILEYVNRVRAPFNVSSLAQAGALAALDDIEHVARSRSLNQDGMARMTAGLARLDLPYTRSQCNFILFDVAPLDGRALFAALLRRGVIVRPMNGYQLPSHLRVSIGSTEENQRFLTALPEALRELRGAA